MSSNGSTIKDAESVNTLETDQESVNAMKTDDEDWSEEWLVDTGASGNVTYSDHQMKNKVPSTKSITVGNGNICAVKTEGDLVFEQHKTGHRLGWHSMVSTGFSKNIISGRKLLAGGYKIVLESTDKAYITSNENETVKIHLSLGDDGMFYLRGKRVALESVHVNEKESTWTDVAKEDLDDTKKPKSRRREKNLPKTMDFNEAHDIWGHKGKGLLQKTAKRYGMKLTGTLAPWEGCGRANAKQKDVSKTAINKAERNGERVYLDTAGPFSETAGGNKYLFGAVDEKSRFGWLKPAIRKKEMVNFADWLIKTLKTYGIPLKYLRCDNAGENVVPLKKLCLDNGIILELTAPYTPQQNGVMERRFAVVINRANAMMIAAGMNEATSHKLWAEASSCANDTENVTLSSVRSVSAQECLTGKQPKLLAYLIQWGRIGVVTIQKKIKGKWKEQGIKMLMVGYAHGHASDTYRFYNPDTKKVVESRDVTWLTWNRLDPTKDMSVFSKDPELTKLPISFDDVDIGPTNQPETPPDSYPER